MNLSMDRWRGKVAIVTGASSGIGAAIARRLVQEGLQVVGLARRKDRLDELSKNLSDKPGKLHPIQTDMTKEQDILKAFEWTKTNLGPVHILVNNAGVCIPEMMHKGSTENWMTTFQVNVIGLSIATREALKDMKANNVNGHIININSLSGHTPLKLPSTSMYSASKHSVTSLTESLRFELAYTGSKIKVTSISPGLVDTEIVTEESRKNDMMKKFIEDKIILEPDDVAQAILYVLSTPPRVQIHELTIRPVGETLA